MTDSEINEAVAMKLGWKPFKDGWKLEVNDWNSGGPKAYATSIAAAFEIVEKIISTVGSDGDYYHLAVSMHKDDSLCVINELSDKRIEEHAPTAPMAICLAFLKLEETK